MKSFKVGKTTICTDDVPVIDDSFLYSGDDLLFTEKDYSNGLVFVSTLCPAKASYDSSSGVGGQMFINCHLCGATMPSTAGPHPPNSFILQPFIIKKIKENIKGKYLYQLERISYYV